MAKRIIQTDLAGEDIVIEKGLRIIRSICRSEQSKK